MRVAVDETELEDHGRECCARVSVAGLFSCYSRALQFGKASLRLTEASLRPTEASLRLTEASLRLTEASLRLIDV